MSHLSFLKEVKELIFICKQEGGMRESSLHEQAEKSSSLKKKKKEKLFNWTLVQSK